MTTALTHLVAFLCGLGAAWLTIAVANLLTARPDMPPEPGRCPVRGHSRRKPVSGMKRTKDAMTERLRREIGGGG